MDNFYMDENLIVTHLGDNFDEHYGAVVPPIFMNSLHIFPSDAAYYDADREDENAYFYGRSANPTVRLLEKRIAALENGRNAICFASGMAAATTAVMAMCSTGDHIICIRNAYGPLKNFLQNHCVARLGMEMTYVDGDDPEDFIKAARDNTRLIVLESPSSVVFSLQDISAVTAFAKSRGIKTYIDNTCATPLFQKPLDMGVDVVMHTMSKYFGGHSDIIGGALVVNDAALYEKLSGEMREWYGGILGPMEAWLVLRGLKTLVVRLQRHEESAMKVAEFLEKHPKVRKVYYPGLKSHPQYELVKKQQTGNGGLISFELNADPDHVLSLLTNENLKIFKFGVSWGGFESLIHMPFVRLGQEEADKHFRASRGIVRIYCGLEGTDNLIGDLSAFLELV